LVMAKASTSCSVRSENLFISMPYLFLRSILNNKIRNSMALAAGSARWQTATMAMGPLRRRLEPAIRRALHFYWRFARGMTIGTRAAVFDAQGRVFLIKHSYVEGWHMPGGGIETGETVLEGLRRELREEGNIEITGTPVLHAIFQNLGGSKRDHIVFYVVREFRQDAPPQPNHEIVEHGFFAPDALPAGTTRSTRLRLVEILRGVAPSESW
jgi:8-oxo-dGTP pyrophosphatase MutT (NUDIX family)